MTEMDRKSIEPATADGAQKAQVGRWPRSTLLGAGAFGLLAVGFAGGAAAWSAVRPHDVSFDPALVPTAIAALADASSVGVDGQVAEIFGNKFVVTDGRARALVETGRAGAGESLVTVGETVTVQGRFDEGILHAAAIRHADQRIDELDPPPPPPGRGPGHHPRPDAAFEGQ